MPIQRRLPKRGFRSRKNADTAEVRLHELNALDADVIDLNVLVRNRVVPAATNKIKVVASGEIARSVKLLGISVTAGAKAAIEAAGGSVEG